MAVSLSLISQSAVRAALDEFDLIGRDAFLEKYKFGYARDFLVQHPTSGTWADSKAIVGAAYGYQFPERGALEYSAFSGGLATVVRLLKSLGFNVGGSEVDLPGPDPGTLRGDAWSREEVELVVVDYLQMLGLELSAQRYNKAARRRALVPMLRARTEASIEFKRRNVSAVMLGLGYPYLRGYLPARNVQSILEDVVEAQLRQMPTLDKAAEVAVEIPAADPDVDTFEASKIPVPRRHHKVQEERPSYFRAVKRDYLERESRNRSLGEAGERFIVEYERWRLVQEGAGQLADKVQHVSSSQGDGLGYDVLSFGRDGTERFLEVKTTAFGELTPFFISSNELKFSHAQSEKFFLCRVFDFRHSPKFFELAGEVERHCQLDPATYQARLH